VKLAYFDQHSDVLLKPERKVIDVVTDAASRVTVDGVELNASQLLERFLFPPAQQHQPVGKLSGGERRRLHLCRLLIEAPNVLLLDEPTNDLDVNTLSVLEDFLEDFRGCVVVVSHDRYFLDRTVDRLFSFEAGTLQRFEGNYSAYLEANASKQAAGSKQAPAAPNPTKTSTTGSTNTPPSPTTNKTATNKPLTQKPAQPRRRSFKESRELESLETNLPAWEARRTALQQELGSGGSDYTALEGLTAELAGLSAQIDAGEERWLALSELAS
jgi:ATP-binding cassette subfamily F protein uup